MYDYVVNKKLEEDPRYQALLAILSEEPFKLWEDGNISVGSLELTQERANLICLANGMNKLVLGFDSFEDLIKKNDNKGIIIFTDDASKRFYRNIEKRLYQNPGRFFPIHLKVDSVSFAEKILKKQSSLKFVYIEGEQMYERILAGFTK
jgi:hypothetical protein